MRILISILLLLVLTIGIYMLNKDVPINTLPEKATQKSDSLSVKKSTQKPSTSSSVQTPKKLQWLSSLQQGKEQAKKYKKPLLVKVGASW